jgi:hypothetical protein
LDRFDALILKIIFKKYYFNISQHKKNLKNNHSRTSNQTHNLKSFNKIEYFLKKNI